MISHTRLLEILDYDPKTGIFRWKISAGRAKAGSVAGTRLANGYWHVMIDYKYHSSHRLAWFYVTRAWPKDAIDHKNGNQGDNSFENLREATRAQNRWNTAGKAGHSKWKGVTYDAGRKKCWKMAFVIPNGVRIQKRFENEREAAEEWMFLALEHHGEFARG